MPTALKCDACGVARGSFGSYQEWSDAASRLGWVVGEDVVLCAGCAGVTPPAAP